MLFLEPGRRLGPARAGFAAGNVVKWLYTCLAFATARDMQAVEFAQV